MQFRSIRLNNDDPVRIALYFPDKGESDPIQCQATNGKDSIADVVQESNEDIEGFFNRLELALFAAAVQNAQEITDRVYQKLRDELEKQERIATSYPPQQVRAAQQFRQFPGRMSFD